MIKLYHRPGARGDRVVWLLEELEVDYELEIVERGVGASSAFRKMNPLGRVPVMLHDDSAVFDSGAMLEYLLERFDTDNRFSPSRDSADWREYIQWMHGAETFMVPVSQYGQHTFIRPEADRVPALAAEAKASVVENLVYLDQLLAERPYLAGDRFSAADIMLGWGLFLMIRIGLIQNVENVENYIAQLESRPALQRVSGDR